MYNAASVKTCFSGLVGYAQPYDPGIEAIDSDLLDSSSSLFISEASPLITIDVLTQCAPAFNTFTYPAYNTLTPYRKGVLVKQGSTLYRAVVDIPGSNTIVPGTDPTKWLETTPFSAWLRQKYETSVVNMMTVLLRDKKIANKGKSLLDMQQLYRGRGTINNRVVKSSSAVGWEIKVSTAEGIANVINQIGGQFDTAQTVTLYLYHSSRVAALKTISLTITTPSDFAWTTLPDTILGYMNEDTNSDGVYYIVYYEDDIVGQAIMQDKDFMRPPCQSCDDWNIQAYNAWSPYFNICNIKIPFAGLNIDRAKLFDTSKVERIRDNTYGLNLNVTSMCDLTDVFCKNKMVMAEALKMQVGLELLREIANSPRITTTHERTKGLAMAELSLTDKSSYINEYNKIMAALDIDFSGHNKTCMPCSTKGKISYGTI